MSEHANHIERKLAAESAESAESNRVTDSERRERARAERAERARIRQGAFDGVRSPADIIERAVKLLELQAKIAETRRDLRRVLLSGMDAHSPEADTLVRRIEREALKE